MALKYIGDLSRQDAVVLSKYASQATRILEFGVGGSTQIICQSVDPAIEIVSLDTKPTWIEKTRAILAGLGVGNKIHFAAYAGWRGRVNGPFDFIFNDGQASERARFAEDAWAFLRVGGVMIFHDTRRAGEMGLVCGFVRRHYLELSEIFPNVDDSNMTVVRRAPPRRHVNWNIKEKRQPWEYGHGDIPEDFFNR